MSTYLHIKVFCVATLNTRNNFQCMHVHCVYISGGGGGGRGWIILIRNKQVEWKEENIKIRDSNMRTNKQGNKTTERMKITKK